MPAARNWPASLIIQSRSQRSSATPTSTMSSVAPRIAQDRAGSDQKIAKNGIRDDTRNAAATPRNMATPPSRGVGVLWTSRSRIRVEPVLEAESPARPRQRESEAAVKRTLKTYASRGVRRLRVRLEQVAEDLTRRRGRQRRRAARGRPARRRRRGPSRRRSSTRSPWRRPPSRYTATAPPASPGVVGGDRRRLAGEVRARDRERPGLLEELEGDPVAGIRTATVPRVSPRSQVERRLRGRTMVSPPGQNSSTSRSTGSGPRRERIERRDARRRARAAGLAPAALGLEQPRDRRGSNASAATP